MVGTGFPLCGGGFRWRKSRASFHPPPPLKGGTLADSGVLNADARSLHSDVSQGYVSDSGGSVASGQVCHPADMCGVATALQGLDEFLISCHQLAAQKHS